MPVVRLTAFFKDDDGRGWTETHGRAAGTEPVNLQQYINDFDYLMRTFRVPMLARDCSYLGCRAAYRSASNRIRSQPLLLNPPLEGPKTWQQQELWSAAPSAAVKLRLTDSTRTANKDVYLRGFWDDVEVAGYVNFDRPIGAEWKKRADAYTALLISNGYGWEGIDPVNTRRGTVESYTVDANLFVEFTVNVITGPALIPGPARVPVRFARLNNSDSVLNRTLVCTVESPTRLRTVEPIAAGPFRGKGTFVLPVLTFIPYAAVSYYRLARRKTGRPFDLQVGRLPERRRT